MARGRKRRTGVSRYKNGKVKNEAQPRNIEVEDTVQLQRARHYGALKREDDTRIGEVDKETGRIRAHVDDPRYGYALGRALIAGVITQKQHDAGADFAATFHQYRGVADMPAPVLPAIDYLNVVRGGHREIEDAMARRIQRRYTGAVNAISKQGIGVFSSVYDVALRDLDLDPRDQRACARIREGLDAADNYFCPKRKKHRILACADN